MGRKYQNLDVYKLAYELAIDIYKLTQDFPRHELGALTNQLRRASVSMPSHIAEGSTRRSEKEFLLFLSYAYGSAKEINVQLSIARDVGYVKTDAMKRFLEDIFSKLDQFQAQIYMFMRHLEKDTPYKFYQEYQKNIHEKHST